MAEFALLIAGEFQEIRDLPEQPVDIEHKAVTWLPVTREYGEPGQGVEDGAYVIRTVDPATLPEPVPPSISDRQFFQRLALDGEITQDEALAAVKTGDIPAALQAFVDTLPDDDKFAAEMLLSGATIFERDHPMTVAIGTGMGKSPSDMDDIWRAGGKL